MLCYIISFLVLWSEGEDALVRGKSSRLVEDLRGVACCLVRSTLPGGYVCRCKGIEREIDVDDYGCVCKYIYIYIYTHT